MLSLKEIKQLDKISKELSTKLSDVYSFYSSLVPSQELDEATFKYQLPNGGFVKREHENKFLNPFTHTHSNIKGLILLIPDKGLMLIPDDKDRAIRLTYSVHDDGFVTWVWDRLNNSILVREVGRYTISGTEKKAFVIEQEMLWDGETLNHIMQRKLVNNVYLIQQRSYTKSKHDLREFLQSVPYYVETQIGRLEMEDYSPDTQAEVLELFKKEDSSERYVATGSGSHKLGSVDISLFFNRLGVEKISYQKFIKSLNSVEKDDSSGVLDWLNINFDKVCNFLETYVENEGSQRYTNNIDHGE